MTDQAKSDAALGGPAALNIASSVTATPVTRPRKCLGLTAINMIYGTGRGRRGRAAERERRGREDNSVSEGA